MTLPKLILLPVFFVVGLLFVELPLKLTFLIWSFADWALQAAGRSGCLGCLAGIPLFAINIAISVLTVPSVLLMFLIGWIDLRLDLTNGSRLELAQHSFFWPHILLFLLMPRLYGVEIIGPTPDLVYILRDLNTDETAMVMPGPRGVAYDPGNQDVSDNG